MPAIFFFYHKYSAHGSPFCFSRSSIFEAMILDFEGPGRRGADRGWWALPAANCTPRVSSEGLGLFGTRRGWDQGERRPSAQDTILEVWLSADAPRQDYVNHVSCSPLRCVVTRGIFGQSRHQTRLEGRSRTAAVAEEWEIQVLREVSDRWWQVAKM